MDIRQLELFLAVIETSSVTKAAQKMNLSPGAVSLQLQNLAAHLRTDLFVRAGKQLRPTPAALRLAEMSGKLLRDALAIESYFQNDPSADARPFNLATGPTSLIHRLPKPLRQLRKQFPNTSIQITVSATEEMVQGLLDRQFDLALISLPVDVPSLEIMPLFQEEMLVLEPSHHAVPGFRIGNITPEKLAASSFLLYPQRSNMRGLINRFFRELGISPNVLMEADDTEAIKGLVESGFGYSILPASALRKQPRFFNVYRIAGHPLTRQQALAMVKAEYPRPLTRSIAQFLQTSLKLSS